MSDCCSSSKENTPESCESSSAAQCCTEVSSTSSSGCSPNKMSHSQHGASDCCSADHCQETHGAKTDTTGGCCDHDSQKRFDWLLWGSLILCGLAYAAHWLVPTWLPEIAQHFAHSVFEMLNTMWWGVLMGIVFVGLLSKVPQEMVLSLLGKGGTMSGLFRATAAGVLLDLCSHGILMVGTRLYKKGASIGQVMAFLIASPWNSFSLTIIMIALIGWKWTVMFILLSAIIAVISGWIFDRLVRKGVLPPNANTVELPSDFRFWPALRTHWAGIAWNMNLLRGFIKEGLAGSKMVLRWLLFGVLLAAAIRSFISLDFFQQWFGPSLIGVLFTLVAATVIEVCSEGSTPIAADLMNRALAPGNSFTFMMAGVSTDYTEIMVLKDATSSWKIALFLPLITLPQILLIGLVLNHVHL